MREVICTTPFEYPPGTAYQPGDRIPMDDDHVFLFRNAGKIHGEDAPPLTPVVDAPAQAQESSEVRTTLDTGPAKRKKPARLES